MTRTSTFTGKAHKTTVLAAAAAAAAAAVLVASGGAALAAPVHHGAGTAAPVHHAAAAAVQLNCVARPSACGYPDASNSGVPAGTVLKSVPSQVSSGPGWKYDPRGWVEVTGNGAVLSGLLINANLDVVASNVTIKDVKVVTSGTFGISLRHTAGVTVEDSTVSGTNRTAGRLNAAIADVYEDSTGMTIEGNNISDFRIGVQAPTGVISGNYIHDPGYIAGDHTNGITAVGSTEPLAISGNTILISLGQTDAITLDAADQNQQVANKAITGNLIAGGAYSIYGGTGNNATTSNIDITGNRFAQNYFPKSGQYGPVAYYDSTAPGSTWTGNIWDTTGQAVSS